MGVYCRKCVYDMVFSCSKDQPYDEPGPGIPEMPPPLPPDNASQVSGGYLNPSYALPAVTGYEKPASANRTSTLYEVNTKMERV